MKLMPLLLSIYLLSLSFLYCNDEKDAIIISNVISAVSNTQDGDHQHDFEYCTPFCICSCCGIFLNIDNLATYNLADISFYSEELFIADDIFNSNLYYSIWQPPKLS